MTRLVPGQRLWLRFTNGKWRSDPAYVNDVKRVWATVTSGFAVGADSDDGRHIDRSSLWSWYTDAAREAYEARDAASSARNAIMRAVADLPLPELNRILEQLGKPRVPAWTPPETT